MSNENIGWVYVLKNPRFDDLKIGFTTYSHPQQRADEISKSTGVPAKFEVMYAALLLNPNRIEQNVHYKLRIHRVSQNREFFSCTILDAMSAIRAAAQNSIIQEIDNRPEIVKAREEAIRKQQEEQRRNEELIRQRQLEKIEEQRRINENKRLELEREKIRKIELEQQKKRLIEINAQIDLEKSGCAIFLSYIISFFLLFGTVGNAILFLVPDNLRNNRIIGPISAILAIIIPIFIARLYLNRNSKKIKIKKLEEERDFLIGQINKNK